MKFVLKVLSKLRLLKFFNLSFRQNGIEIPILGGLGCSNIDGTERWMIQIIQYLLKETDGCFVDVGVNEAQTLIKVKQIDKNIKYIGFEPNPYCVFYVEELIRINKFTNCEIIPAGISSSNNIVTLNYSAGDLTDSSATMIPDFRPEKITTGKNIVVVNYEIIKEKLIQKIGILKIDVEGAELYVIQGIKPLIRRDRPFIAIEVLPVYSDSRVDRLSRQNELEEELRELNYSIIRVVKNLDDAFNKFELIKNIGIHSNISNCDYIFSPEEKVNIFLS